MSDDKQHQPEDHELWEMHIADALPLIVKRFNVTEYDAYWLWRNHQPKNQPGPDVIGWDAPDDQA